MLSLSLGPISLSFVLCAFASALIGCRPGSHQSQKDGGEIIADVAIDRAISQRPRIIILIGDGMGAEQERASSLFKSGSPDNLAWHGFDSRAELLTASPSGITDSAAAATAMACGELTYNGSLGIDRLGKSCESIFDVAKQHKLATGFVTTASVVHATPAAFAVHQFDRYDYASIAQELLAGRTDVIFGGGRMHLTTEQIETLRARGIAVVFNADELAAIDDQSTRAVGLFSDAHFPYVGDREATVPGLTETTRKAIDLLDRNPAGFVLIVEAGRIDRALHDRDLATAIGEIGELDETAELVAAWGREREGVTVLVLADHETGGLEISEASAVGQLPDASWRWGRHTNRRVGIAGDGPGASVLANGPFDPRIVSSIARARISGTDVALPDPLLIANGELHDHADSVAVQDVASNFAEHGQLDKLFLSADGFGVTIGVEGTFSMSGSSLVVALDHDFGAGTGAATFVRSPPASTDVVDNLIANFEYDLNSVAGWGADFAIASVAGTEATRGAPWPGAGWRQLRAADGAPLGAPPLGIALTYDDGVRTANSPAVARSRRGVEISIAFDALFPDGMPPGTEVAIACVLTSLVGQTNSNQALPTGNRVVVISLDADFDGVVDLNPSTRVESATGLRARGR